MSRTNLLLLILAACSSAPPTPAAQKSSITAAKTSAIAINESVRVDVVVRDVSGQPMQGVPVVGTLRGTGGMVSTGPVTTAEGAASLTVSSSTVGSKTLSVKAGETALGEVSLSVVAGPPVGFEFVTQPMTVKAGVVMAPVTLCIVDAQGNTSAAPYRLSLRLVRSNGGTLSGGAQKDAVDGGLTFDMLVVNRPQPGYALRGESPTGAAGESNLFDVTAGDPDMGMSSLAAMPASIATGVMTTLTLTVRDVAGNLLSGRAVVLSASGTGNAFAMSSGTTGGNGVFTTTFSSTVAEVKTLTATIGTVMVSTMVTVQ